MHWVCSYVIQDMKKKEKELQAKEAELNKRESVCAFCSYAWNLEFSIDLFMSNVIFNQCLMK
jgi:hypothetical protein